MTIFLGDGTASPGFVVVDSDSVTSACQVSGPTTPSALNPSACWNPRTQAWVFGPQTPSTFSEWPFLTLRKFALVLDGPPSLPEHFQAGRLTQDQFDDRSRRARQGPHRRDLGGLFAELPPRRA